MKPPLTTACSLCAWMVKEGSDVTFTSASISPTEDLPISSVYNIFWHQVHVNLWVKILCNTITHEQQVHNHSISIRKNAPFPILKKTKNSKSASSTDGWWVVSEGAPPHKCRLSPIVNREGSNPLSFSQSGILWKLQLLLSIYKYPE